MHRWLLAPSLLVAACGGAAPASSMGERPAGEVDSPLAHEVRPATARELVALLQAIAEGARPGSLDDHIDADFARSLPSGIELGELFVVSEEGCTPELEEGPGYGAIAIPPPMEGDSEEEIRRTEAIIEVLQASTEVFASCTVTRTVAGAEGEEDEVFEERVPLWAIAVGRRDDGRLVALAWRRLDDERH